MPKESLRTYYANYKTVSTSLIYGKHGYTNLKDDEVKIVVIDYTV